MENNNNWSKINDELSELVNKFQNKAIEDNLLDDLKFSFKETIESTNNIFKNISDVIENTIKDDEIKNASRELINNLYEEFENTVNISKQNLIKNIKLDISKEEE
tara:strand:- start:2414 stop:2728 length:315 start_codon:yes stop_codon:yes gene_type:complete